MSRHSGECGYMEFSVLHTAPFEVIVAVYIYMYVYSCSLMYGENIAVCSPAVQVLVVMRVGREGSLARGSSVCSAMTLTCALTVTRPGRQGQGDTAPLTPCSVSSPEWTPVRGRHHCHPACGLERMVCGCVRSMYFTTVVSTLWLSCYTCTCTCMLKTTT